VARWRSSIEGKDKPVKPDRPVVVARNDKPTPRRKRKTTAEEYPRMVAIVLNAYERAAIDPIPEVVDHMAMCLLGEVEHDRRLVAAKLDEVAGERSCFTASEIEWFAHYIREAPRDDDGDFAFDVKGPNE
jgi:hypothetical protein